MRSSAGPSCCGRTPCRPAAVDRALEKVERNAQMQSRLVEDLLEVSRIITRQAAARLRPFDLVALCDVGDRLDPSDRRGARRHASSAQFDGAALPTVGDPDRLQQVIWNLLSNAVKFTPAGGTVTLTLRRRRRDRRDRRHRHRHRHRAGVPAERLRPVPSGRRLHHARARRARPRAVDREAARRSARRGRVGGQLRVESRCDVHRAPAGAVPESRSEEAGLPAGPANDRGARPRRGRPPSSPVR